MLKSNKFGLFLVWEDKVLERGLELISIKARKVFAFALIIILSSLTGCTHGGSNFLGLQSASPLEDSIELRYPKKIQWTIMARDTVNTYQPFVEDDQVVAFIEQKFNADLTFIKIASPKDSSAYMEQLNILLASGNIPDLINVQNATTSLSVQINNALYGNSMVVEIGELLSQNAGRWPMIEADCYAEDVEEYYHSDGHLYVIPRYYGLYPHAFIYRKDWLEMAGMQEPKTLQELYEMAKVFVDKDYDSQGTSGITIGAWWLNHFTTGFVGAGHQGPFAFLKDQDGKIQYSWTQPEMRDAITFYNQMYREGVLDPDFLNFTVDEGIEKIASGNTGVFCCVLEFIDDIGARLLAYNPNAKLGILPVDLRGPKAVARITGSTLYEAMAINKEAEDIERMMDMMEWMRSDEAFDIYENGIQGIHYRIDASGSKITDEEIFRHENWKLPGLRQSHGVQTMVSGYPFMVGNGYDKNLSMAFRENLKNSTGIFKRLPEVSTYSPVLEEKGARIDRIRDEYFAKFIMGDLQINDENWNKCVNDLLDMGVREELAYRNQQ